MDLELTLKRTTHKNVTDRLYNNSRKAEGLHLLNREVFRDKIPLHNVKTLDFFYLIYN